MDNTCEWLSYVKTFCTNNQAFAELHWDLFVIYTEPRVFVSETRQPSSQAEIWWTKMKSRKQFSDEFILFIIPSLFNMIVFSYMNSILGLH